MSRSVAQILRSAEQRIFRSRRAFAVRNSFARELVHRVAEGIRLDFGGKLGERYLAVDEFELAATPFREQVRLRFKLVAGRPHFRWEADKVWEELRRDKRAVLPRTDYQQGASFSFTLSSRRSFEKNFQDLTRFVCDLGLPGRIAAD
jgi:hypothetical protein